MRDNEKKSKTKKIAIIVVLVIIALFIIGLAVGWGFINGKLNKINYEEVDQSQVEITEGIEENLSEYRNIVLFGIDDVDGYIGRSDCIILFSINENTKDVKMTSIYRDTYVEVPEHGLTKINHAYAYDGPVLAMNTINRNLDLDVKEYVTINFQVVKDIVDAVGGVKIKLTAKEAERVPGIDKKGTYNLTGEQALTYGRIRKIDSDYARTERMRTVITAVFDKIKTMSVTEMNKLADELLPELHTNIQKSEITKLMADAPEYSMGKSIGWPYKVEGKTIDGVWYGVPKTLRKSVEKLHEELFGEEDYEASKTVKDISSKIVDETDVK